MGVASFWTPATLKETVDLVFIAVLARLLARTNQFVLEDKPQ
jgi:hypothetical protein